MIYLSTIMNSDIWNLTPLHESINVQRIVASVTIMESLPIKDWAKGGELLLTSSKTLPESEQELLGLLTDMQQLSTAALAIKCKETEKELAQVRKLANLAQDKQIPIFLIPPQRTYLSLTNAINRLLSQEVERDSLKEYLMKYLLLSKEPKKDLIVHRCAESLQLPLFQKKIQLIQFQLHKSHKETQVFEQQRYSFFLHACDLFEQMKQNKLLFDFIFMHTDNVIYTCLLMDNEKKSIACIAELSNMLKKFPSVHAGISSIQTAEHTANMMMEAEFSVHAGTALAHQQITSYSKIQLLHVIYNLQTQDNNQYLHKVIEPLLEHPFLLDTLTKYFRNNENQKVTCKELFIHVNTLQYRLKKIETLTNLHLNNIQDKMYLYVALLSYMIENWRDEYDYD